MKFKKRQPSRAADKILKILLRQDDYLERSGDLEEAYYCLIEETGLFKAGLWFWFQVLKVVPISLKNTIYWRLSMLKNYIKITLRNIKKHKVYSFINIAGLTVGMTCCILIYLWAQNELSYDRFHKSGGRICRMIRQEHFSGKPQKKGARVSAPLGPEVKAEFPEIVEVARTALTSRRLFQYQEKGFFEQNLCFADPSLLKMFTFPLIKGDPETALSDPYSMILSEEMALKYFGDEDPIGKSLTVQKSFDVVITGVMKTIPVNSHLRFDFLGRFEICEKEFGWGAGWGNINYTTYLQIAEKTSFKNVEAKIHRYLEKREGEEAPSLFLQPLEDIYLRSDFNYDFTGSSGFRSTYVTIFSIIAFFVLAIACINFMNLSTARSGKRAREVGIRKVAGADKSRLIRQFLGESIVMSFLSLMLAIFLVSLILPAFKRLSGKNISMLSSWNLTALLALACIVLITGVIAGSYPAFLLSSYQPVKVLKGTPGSTAARSGFRKALVLVQFSLSIFLIIGTLTVYKQLEFIQNKNLGFDRDRILITRLFGNMLSQIETVKTELKKSPYIENVSAASDIQTNTYHASSGTAVWWEGKLPDENIMMYHYDIDENFIPTMGMHIIDGRNFSSEFSLDRETGYIVNETAVRVMDIKDPVGKQFRLWSKGDGKIIGVVEDFHFKSLHNEIGPMIFRVRPEGYYYLLIKVKSPDVEPAIKNLEAVCKEFNPDFPFDYFFLDDAFDRLYQSEERMGTIITYFACLAVFISCLGLFGLTSFMTEQRKKEVGIRKILGASISEIARLFAREFTVLLAAANLIAWPASFFAMKQWLQGFAYRTNLGILIFLFSALLAVLIAMATIGYQSIKAALANPVDSLRYE